MIYDIEASKHKCVNPVKRYNPEGCKSKYDNSKLITIRINEIIRLVPVDTISDLEDPTWYQ